MKLISSFMLVALPLVTMASPLANLFGNNMGGFNAADILNGGGGNLPDLASSLFNNNANPSPLSGILKQLSGGGGGQSDAGASGDCSTGSFLSAFGAAGNSPFGGITDMIGGGNIDFCKAREEPESEKQVSWTDLQEFLKNPQAQISKRAKESCMKQVEDEKARCERQKKVMCQVLNPTASPDQLISAFKDNICEDQRQKQAADACKQVTGMILGGRGLSQAEITNAVKDTATKGATTNLLCNTDPADLDAESLLDPNKAQSAIKAAQAAKTANELLGSSGGNPASALGNLGNGGGNPASALANLGNGGSNPVSALSNLGNGGGNPASALSNLGNGGANPASALSNLGNTGGNPASALSNLGNAAGGNPASALGNLGNAGANNPAAALGNLGNAAGGNPASALGNLGSGGAAAGRLGALGALGRFRRHLA